LSPGFRPGSSSGWTRGAGRRWTTYPKRPHPLQPPPPPLYLRAVPLVASELAVHEARHQAGEDRVNRRSMPTTPSDLFAFLDRLGIAHATVTHPALFTVEQSPQLRGTLPGGHTQDLVLKA